MSLFHRTYLTIIAIAVLGTGAFSQKSVDNLQPTHAEALNVYLSSNKNLKFRQEDNLGDEYLKDVRKSRGKTFMPNYAVADFNRDKMIDFAVLLYRDGKPEFTGPDGKEEPITEHNPDFPLRLVVFNGGKAGFKVAHTEDLMGPHAAFIAFNKRLYYGVFESDADTFILAPAGRSYIMEFEESK
jgi:hypothetical protein